MNMDKAKSGWIVIMVREGVCVGSTPTRRDEDDTSSQAQNCDKFSTALVLRVMEEAWG
jgi:hypothetical protein